MDILLTGGSGQVGQSMQELSWPKGMQLHAPGRKELNLLDDRSVSEFLYSRPWAAIINAGAYTAVDAAETDIKNAWKVNAFAPEMLAAFAQERDIPILHLSTDYVFSGNNVRPWLENDHTEPLNVYGESKLAGERAVRANCSRHLILRTSWVVSPFGRNFIKTILDLARDRPLLRVVGDQVGRPTVANSLAQVVQEMMVRMIAYDIKASGTVHVANAGETSWADLAREILSISAGLGGPYADVETITTQDFPTPAQRPLYSTLSTCRLEEEFDMTMCDWREELPKVIARLMLSMKGQFR
jgi:dTDP-4-dehydrorhamnose reductase